MYGKISQNNDSTEINDDEDNFRKMIKVDDNENDNDINNKNRKIFVPYYLKKIATMCASESLKDLILLFQYFELTKVRKGGILWKVGDSSSSAILLYKGGLISHSLSEREIDENKDKNEIVYDNDNGNNNLNNNNSNRNHQNSGNGNGNGNGKERHVIKMNESEKEGSEKGRERDREEDEEHGEDFEEIYIGHLIGKIRMCVPSCVCMYVCMCVRKYVCIDTCIHMCVCKSICVCVYAYVCVCVCVRERVCVCVLQCVTSSKKMMINIIESYCHRIKLHLHPSISYSRIFLQIRIFCFRRIRFNK